MNLPPFPSIPASPEERLRLIQYGEVCARAGMERAAVICEQHIGFDDECPGISAAETLRAAIDAARAEGGGE